MMLFDFTMNSSKLSKVIKKGSSVSVLSGSFKGKTGVVSKVMKSKVLIDSLFYKTSVKTSEDGSKAYENKMCPIDISNVKII